MNYDKEIISVLTEAGSEGLSIGKIARHVFNACNSMFDVLSFKDVHAYVAQYLQRNSKNCNSVIARTEKRGVYRLNYDSQEVRQLMLQFSDDAAHKEEEDTARMQEDGSLWLFGDLPGE